MHGLLNIDKPAGLTSRDVVNRVQRLVKPHKAGHAGTLDPLATGVLVVAVGAATRLVEYVQRMRKTYRGTFLFGRMSDTEDIAGQVQELPSPPIPSLDDIKTALPRFVGSIEQRPPAFSALKVAGQRAYDLARRGEAVDLAPRTVEIYSLDLLRYDYPQLELRVACGSGTYIRSLGRDLAEALGTGAVMSALRREAIGPFTIQDAIAVDALLKDNIAGQLLPSQLATSALPQLLVNAADIQRLFRGQAIQNRCGATEAELAVIDDANELVAIVAAHGPELRPLKCFPPL